MPRMSGGNKRGSAAKGMVKGVTTKIGASNPPSPAVSKPKAKGAKLTGKVR